MSFPYWKIRRELKRIGQQLQGLPELWSEPRIQKRHDDSFETGFPLYCGRLERAEKIALLLVYQPDQLCKSILYSCEVLARQGYAPLVVANGGLQQADRTILEPLVWQIMERPNVGYDFGGYRDGIRLLWKLGVSPQHLLVMNDSVWFPLQESSTFLTDLENAEGDICGTVLRHRSGGIQFLESYCYLIRSQVLNAPAFHSFWQEFRLTSNKYKVIRRGERGFSMAMHDAGFKVTGLFSEEMFLDQLKRQADVFLRCTLHYGSHHDPAVEETRQKVLAKYGSHGWRDDAMDYVMLALRKGQFYSAFPYAMVTLLGYPILKKSKDLTAVAWRRAYRKALADQILPMPHPSIQAELYES